MKKAAIAILIILLFFSMLNNSKTSEVNQIVYIKSWRMKSAVTFYAEPNKTGFLRFQIVYRNITVVCFTVYNQNSIQIYIDGNMVLNDVFNGHKASYDFSIEKEFFVLTVVLNNVKYEFKLRTLKRSITEQDLEKEKYFTMTEQELFKLKLQNFAAGLVGGFLGLTCCFVAVSRYKKTKIKEVF